jgi:hypothetical protein
MTDFIVTENYHLRLKRAIAKILIEKISLSFDAAMNYKTKNHTDQYIHLEITEILQPIAYSQTVRKFRSKCPLIPVPA